jgi:hypothetical protein
VILQEPTDAGLIDNLTSLRQQFKLFTERMDSLRSENLLDLVPELAELLL